MILAVRVLLCDSRVYVLAQNDVFFCCVVTCGSVQVGTAHCGAGLCKVVRVTWREVE